ncbi:MAG: hypothetical protein ACRENS_06225 [Candidatus Eiseniibacteriota bacterium]
MFHTEHLIWGVAGGLVPDLLRIIAARTGPVPSYLKSRFFFVSLALLALLGGLAVGLIGAGSPKEAFAIGFAAPEIISRLGAKSAGGQAQGMAARGIRSVREWWAV